MEFHLIYIYLQTTTFWQQAYYCVVLSTFYGAKIIGSRLSYPSNYFSSLFCITCNLDKASLVQFPKRFKPYWIREYTNAKKMP